MKRRDFLLLAGATAMTWNRAMAEVRIPRIGFIHVGSRQENESLLEAFRDNLSTLGWTEGSNIAVLDRWADDRSEALPAIIKELIGSGVTILDHSGGRRRSGLSRASSKAWGNLAATSPDCL